MVWDSACLEVVKSSKTKLEAPLGTDGKPDMKRAVVKGLVVTYDPSCGNSRIEIRRDN